MKGNSYRPETSNRVYESTEKTRRSATTASERARTKKNAERIRELKEKGWISVTKLADAMWVEFQKINPTLLAKLVWEVIRKGGYVTERVGNPTFISGADAETVRKAVRRELKK